MGRYRILTAITLILGLGFIALQVIGFQQLWNNGFTLQSNVSVSFLYVIVALHALHVIGGIIALIVMSLKAFSKKVRSYSTVPVELITTYWHFVDILWIYLLIFLLMIR
jgi:cytochrome c oxidase subunit 3